ncbi:hypothetical protein [Microlunatus speluncae]|uniref:hypothetical protein n=1 Tax=Microlunatus speluncae TaxID=2594267 RepID=UPI0012661B85|nr:hypothetical protein [Microlunatus speluncae]
MSILKPLVKGVVAGAAVLATTIAGIGTASADTGGIELTGKKGSVTVTRAQATNYLADSMEYQLYREFRESGATRNQAAALADKITDKMRKGIKSGLPTKGTMSTASASNLESSMERYLERVLEADVSLSIDSGTLTPTLDLPGGVDLAGLIEKVLNLVASLLDSLTGALGGVVPIPELPELPEVPEVPVSR